jgi:ribonuclease HI
MTTSKPHFLLFCDGNVSASRESAGSQRGRWRFVLEDLVSGEKIEATDQEIGCAPDRSALVAVLRGLEALEQPSRVTLVTTSRYVTRGLQYGLTEWRDNDYSWEHFGAVQPIRNADIWKRLDRALAYHQVQCRWMAQEGGAESNDDSPTQKNETNSIQAHNKAIPDQAAVTCVEKAATVAAHPNHRPSRSASATRVGVSTSKYQRVYVDTPNRNLSNTPAEITVNSQHGYVSEIERKDARALPNLELQTHFNGIFQSPISSLKNLAYLLSWPVRFISRGPLRLCSHLWDGILTLDEWLESFLRCLLLLDPSKRTKRR